MPVNDQKSQAHDVNKNGEDVAGQSNACNNLVSQRISRDNRSRSDAAGRLASRLRKSTIRRRGSPGIIVALLAISIAALIALKINYFPGQIQQPDITKINEKENITIIIPQKHQSKSKELVLKAEDFSPSLVFAAGQNDFPTLVDVEIQGYEFTLKLEYTLNQSLQSALSKWLDRYDPDFAVAVAIDPDSGRILALTTHVSDGKPLDNLAMSSAFPAASVFKIVTAAAAMDMGKLDPGSITPFNGKSTTLYKKNVFHHNNNKWTRKFTLSEAFAKSANTVFGRIGIYTVGSQKLNEYANRFHFNSRIITDISIDPSVTYIPSDDDWAVAEAASGYTKKVTLSPLHAAMLAASMINEGKLMRPYMVDRAYDMNGRLVYKGDGKQLALPITPNTAKKMQKLMTKTIIAGTARRSFSTFFKGQYRNLKVGGKTGTLSGGNLEGLNDWFVGYAYDDNHKLAYAVLNINLDKWKVKSHYLSRLMIEHYFDSIADVEITVSTGD